MHSCFLNLMKHFSVLKGLPQVCCLRLSKSPVPQPLQTAVLADPWNITTVLFEMDCYEKICSKRLLWKYWIRCKRIFEATAMTAHPFFQRWTTQSYANCVLNPPKYILQILWKCFYPILTYTVYVFDSFTSATVLLPEKATKRLLHIWRCW